MIAALDAARYLISLDTKSKYFTKNRIKINNCQLYEGSARLNKILHLAQNFYIGKHEKKFIKDDFYAYANGGVIPSVRRKYTKLLETKNISSFNISQEDKDYLHKVFIMLKDAPIDELIAIDHEDPAWIKNHTSFKNKKFDSLEYVEDYKVRYEAANFYLDRMIEL